MTLVVIDKNISIEYEIHKAIDQKSEYPVILLNGTIFNYKQWFPALLPAFLKESKSNYTYLLYNYQGVGQSSPMTGKFSLNEMVDELKGLMDALDITKAHLFGMSIGNMLGQMMSGTHPDKVVSLAGYGIVSLLGDMTPAIEDYKTRIRALDNLDPKTLDDRINKENYDQIIKTVYLPLLFGKSEKLSLKQKLILKIISRKIKPMLLGTPVISMYHVFSNYVESLLTETEKASFTDNLKSIPSDLPILFQNGTADTTTNIENAKKVLEYLPRANFIELQGFKHISPALKKREARKIMKNYLEFLNRLS